ncbi:MAG: DUF2807 domain-containing protein [Prevotella sp.]|nr:DUF2807 domain-containing protein [Prevotella sp.]
MKKRTMMLLAAGVVLLCTSCHFRINTEMDMTENRTHVRDFEKIEVLGAMDVEYVQGDSFEVKVVGRGSELNKVETVVKDHTLQIRMNDSYSVHRFGIVSFGNSSSDNVKVMVMSPDLIGVTMSGSGNFDCDGMLDTDVLDIKLNGSGDVEFKDVICDQINVRLVGSGDVEVKKVKTLMSDLELIGSGDIKMKFDDAKAVKARLIGSGDIELSGNVDMLNSSAHGSGDLNTDKLTVKNNM